MDISGLTPHKVNIYKCTAAIDANRGSTYKTYALSGTAECRFRPTTSITTMVQGITKVVNRAIIYYPSVNDISQFDRVEFESVMWDVISVVDNNKVNVFKTALLQRV